MTTETGDELEMLRNTLRGVRKSGSELYRMRAALALAFLETAIPPLTGAKAEKVSKIINGETG